MSKQISFYGTATALQIELVETEAFVPTLQFQHALLGQQENKKKQGDWDRAIRTNLNGHDELIKLVQLLTRKRQSSELSFRFHGSNNNKGLTLKRLPTGKLEVVSGYGKNNIRKIVLEPWGSTHILTLAYKAYASRYNIEIIEAVSILNVSPADEG
ncbi:hypothetical protein ACPV5U_19085 [Vibrio mediterranei]